ncbi:MAG: bifunctional oligoribonuclease/PAP phosphatase NrnA [Armatimonadota bacterium]
MIKNSFQEAARFLIDNRSFLIAGHVNPDGDTLGGMCALALALKRMGKEVAAVCADEVPDSYRFLPGSEYIMRQIPKGAVYDAAIVVDCDGLGRAGELAQTLRKFNRMLEIDHHQGEGSGIGLTLIFSTAASCGEIIYNLMQQASIEIDSHIADCLLTAIITDTGSYRFTNVTPDTLRISADLVQAGGSPCKISQKVYDPRTLSATKLLGYALSSICTAADGRIAYTSVSKAQMADAGADESETEGIVNYVRSVKGAEIGVLFRESSDGGTRISLRSVAGVDISPIARMFGGGGHKVAAGCSLNLPLTDAIDKVLEALISWMGY